MESLDEQLKEFLVLKDEKHTSSAYGCIDHGKVSELVGKLRQKQCESLNKKIAPSVPPKPSKKNFEMPQVPSSKQVSCSREPLYSQPLMGVDKTINGPIPLRKPASTDWEKSEIQMNNKTTLDNPAILEQQLEALAYHKLQMEKKGLLGVQSQPEKSAISFLETMPNNTENSKLFPKDSRNTYLSIHKELFYL
ncbi:uncharacterized protein LOC108095013 isoform X2 [Drosophila ficusphila]|uniref:uncharacterized protein LOC108095013 isoform X2 n=1 Tax=Drosophila ficusphila TaxID=30025 RepID=UPI0007E8704F|nr:uncharacterized protein LOC108095013 isoform X2 [Drosophila ficusphila]